MEVGCVATFVASEATNFYIEIREKKKKTKKLCFVNSQKGEAENPEQSRQTNTAVKQPVVFN